MATHEYSPADALKLLMSSLERYSPELAHRVQSAVDNGKEIEQVETFSSGGKRRRVYKKTLRFTDEEALDVAQESLKAYFLERQLFINSAVEDFRTARIGQSEQTSLPLSTIGSEAKEDAEPDNTGTEIALEVEVQTETRVTLAERETVRLIPANEAELESLRVRLDQLAAYLTFGRD